MRGPYRLPSNSLSGNPAHLLGLCSCPVRSALAANLMIYNDGQAFMGRAAMCTPRT